MAGVASLELAQPGSLIPERASATPGSTRPLWPRNAPSSLRSSRTAPVGGAAKLQPNSEVPTTWSPYGTFVPAPYHEGMPASLMAVAQAHTVDKAANPFPANGAWDVPNAQHAVAGIMRLKPTTSAHPGLTMATGAGPTMVFAAPPIFGYQTKPIMATGV